MVCLMYLKCSCGRCDFVTDLPVFVCSVVPDAIIKSSDLAQGATVTALSGGTLTVSSLSPPTINGSVVVQADVLANNGIVHVIDSVLVPDGFEMPSNTALLEGTEDSDDDSSSKSKKSSKDV